MNDLMTLRELVAEAAAALSDAALDQPSGRVSEVPTARTVRYYATHGLLDRPARYDGRTALYTRRHLMQLVAIKRLQARGLTLDEVQARLIGCADATLAEASGLALDPSPPPDDPRQDDFWRAEPVARDMDAPVLRLARGHPGAWPRGAPLDEDVLLLLLQPRRELDDDDVAALQAAAAPLLRVLHARHLI